MVSRFKVSDFIYTDGLTKAVVEKIERYHLPVVEKLPAITYIVGFRSFAHEIRQGRSGTSQHTFEGKGAVDLGSSDMVYLLDALVETPYTRICMYEGFFHCDYKTSDRRYYIDREGWDRVELDELKKEVYEFERSRSVDILYTIA